MPLPTAWTQVRVFGTYIRTDGLPSQGSVHFDIDQEVVVQDDTGTVIAVLPRRLIAPLDADGHFEIMLPATDDPAISPTGWTWQVGEKFAAGQGEYSIEVPVALADQGINLVQYPHATPVPVNPPVVSYLTVQDIGITVASQTDMQNAIDTANAADAAAAAAVVTANQAGTDASNALSIAEGIDGKAQTALDNANAAVATANDASATANAIAGTANTALANANAAVVTANQAETDAQTAITTANGIAGTANAALTAANNAVTTANSAETDAQTAITTANAAQAAVASKLDATANAVSASKWQTARNLSLTGAITAALNGVDGSANVSAVTTLAAHSVGVTKIDATGSTPGQFMQSNGAGNDAQWAWAPYAFKNRIINGNFDIWQRALSRTAAVMNQCTADRWRDIGVGSTVAPSQQAFALGQTAVANEPAFFHRTVVASVAGANNLAALQQNIEGVRTYAGKTVTLSFYAKADAAKSIGVEFVQNFGTGGSPSAAVGSIGAQAIALTTAWTKYTVVVAIPSIAGKTIGTAGNDNLQLNFWMDAGSASAARASNIGQQSGTFDHAQVQIEEGGYATSFEQRPYQVELALCQRYFEKSYDINVFPGTVVTAGIAYTYVTGVSTAAANSTAIKVDFKVTKGGTPTVVWYSPATGTAGKVRDSANNADINIAGPIASMTNAIANMAQSSANTQINMQGHWTAEWEI
jgi:hypothetical protein